MLEIAFAKLALPKAGALALLVAEEETPSGLWAETDAATGGAIGRALQATSFKGSKKQSCTILAPGAGLSRVIVVGLGKAADLTALDIEHAGGVAAAALRREPIATLAAPGLSAAQLASAGLGAVLRAYAFDRYRTKQKPDDKPLLTQLTVLVPELASARGAWAGLQPIADGVFLTRDLVTEPPNVLNPAEFAERCTKLRTLGLTVEVLGPQEMRELGFGALLGVAQGSVNEPRMVVMEWNGAGGTPAKGKRTRKSDTPASAGQPATAPLAFIGKGVTFDSGGISIKPAGGMEDMKWDMAGAGAVTGLMAVLAGRRAKVNAVGLIGLVENMPSGSAQRPGDVVTTYSGQTVEIINTDAEGRMVLADVLWYCQQRYSPRFMIDLATLTGAIIVSLGHEFGGLFSNDDALSDALLASGRATGEKLWRMPMDEAFDRVIKSDIADMKHVGGRPGGSISAAHFIKRFVNERPWAHLDIAGVAWSSKDAPCTPKGATAYGVRLLDHLVATQYEG